MDDDDLDIDDIDQIRYMEVENLCYIENVYEMVNNAFQLLKPNGTLILETPNEDDYLLQFVRTISKHRLVIKSIVCISCVNYNGRGFNITGNGRIAANSRYGGRCKCNYF